MRSYRSTALLGLFLSLSLSFLACSPAPAAELAPPAPDGAAEVDMSLQQKLLDIRKRWDIYPWAEIVSVDVPAGTAAGQLLEPSIKPNQAMLVTELTYGAFQQYVSAGIPTWRPFNFDLQWFLDAGGANRTPLVDLPVGVKALLGDAAVDWHRGASGLFLEKDQELLFKANTLDAIGADGFGGRLQLVARGYRLYDRGTINPPQLTLEELRTAGAKLDDHPVGVRIALGANTDDVPLEYVFKNDFVATRLAIAASGNGDDSTLGGGQYTGAASTIEVKVEADRQVMSDRVNRLALVGTAPKTVWQWPIPISIRKGTRWTFRAKHSVAPTGPDATGTKVDFVLHGYARS